MSAQSNRNCLGWEWVGARFLPHALAADLPGSGCPPRIHDPDGLRHSQRPRRRAGEPPPEELAVPS